MWKYETGHKVNVQANSSKDDDWETDGEVVRINLNSK
jgi:hypothetical protein